MTESLKKQYVNELKFKDQVDSSFLIKFLGVMEGRDGRSYLNIILTDSSGDLEARMWHSAHEISKQIEKGQLVHVKGKVNQFQGRKQLVIQEIVKLPAEQQADLSPYLPKSKYNPEEMFGRLQKIVDSLDDIYLKTLLETILADEEMARRLKSWPAGKSIHHPYTAGLLEHILSCTEIGLLLASHYEVNRNFVVAGTLLHDLCKIYELSASPTVDYTEEGKLIGHLAKSLEVVDKFASKIPNFPEATKLHLKHILLSHHGSYDFGSPKLPQTKEALLVHIIDLCDSKMASFDWIKKTDPLTGQWSSYVKHLDRIVYKGDLPHYPDWIENFND